MDIGGTRLAELHRSAERFEEICQKQGAYFGLAFLYDIGYGREEIKAILKIMGDNRLGMKEN